MSDRVHLHEVEVWGGGEEAPGVRRVCHHCCVDMDHPGAASQRFHSPGSILHTGFPVEIFTIRCGKFQRYWTKISRRISHQTTIYMRTIWQIRNSRRYSWLWMMGKLDVLNFTRVVAKEREIIGQSKRLEYLIKKTISSIEDVARINQNEWHNTAQQAAITVLNIPLRLSLWSRSRFTKFPPSSTCVHVPNISTSLCICKWFVGVCHAGTFLSPFLCCAVGIVWGFIVCLFFLLTLNALFVLSYTISSLIFKTFFFINFRDLWE